MEVEPKIYRMGVRTIMIGKVIFQFTRLQLPGLAEGWRHIADRLGVKPVHENNRCALQQHGCEGRAMEVFNKKHCRIFLNTRKLKMDHRIGSLDKTGLGGYICLRHIPGGFGDVSVN